MRIALSSAALVVILAGRAAAQCECPASDVLVIGHRGAGTNDASEAFFENTIESAQQAFAEGADMVEIDVQLSSDGALVLMHDDTVDRTTDGTGCVSALTLAQIGALDAGGGASVPTLGAFLAAVNGDVNIEIKLHETDACPAQDLNMLVDAVRADVVSASAQDRVIVSSFSLDVLRRLRATDPSIEIGYLTTNTDDIDVAAAEGFEAIHLFGALATPRTVGQAHDAGLRVNVWTLNGASAVTSMLEVGVDAVITDTAAEAVGARSAFCDAYVCPGADAGVDGGTGSSSGGCAAAPGRRRSLVLFLAALAALVFSRRRPSDLP
jgi:glycerophosphoryl diester phosphodiesterase